MSKSFIYAVNTNSQTLGTTTVVNFGSTLRRFGENLRLNNGNLNICGIGYYLGEANITITGGTGTASATWYADGVIIPGATQSVVLDAGGVVSLNIPFADRLYKCCDTADSLTLVIAGNTGGAITNAMLTAQRL